MKRRKSFRAAASVLSAVLCLSAAMPAAAYADGEQDRGMIGEAAGTAETIEIAGNGETSGNAGAESHGAYIRGFEDGTIRPQASVTRAQAAQMIFALTNTDGVDDPSDGSLSGGEDGNVLSGDTAEFSDVPENAWYYEAVTALTQSGVLNGYEDGTFLPDREITRAELASIVIRTVDSQDGSAADDKDTFSGTAAAAETGFSDVPADAWYAEAVSEASENGWITGYADNTFRPFDDATRAESVVMLNRAFDRSADRFTLNIADDIRVMPDVTSSHWAYYDLIEALTEHTCDKTETGESWVTHEPGTVDLEAGWHNIGGELFHVNDRRLFDYRTEVDGLTLDTDGRYTTGDAELDALLTEAAKEALTDGMSQEQRLRAMYDYAMETFSYRSAENVETGSTGWETRIAKTMLSTKKGNCYSWAAAYTYLARKVGYPATAIAGESISPRGNRSVHAWTEIVIDGTAYTFDPEIEAVYAATYDEDYDLFMKEYGTTPLTYLKPEVQEPEPDPGEGAETDPKLMQILDLVYEGIESPATAPVALSAENEKFYLGVEGLDYRAGIGSDALITSIPHSVVLIEMNEGADIEAAKRSIKENADGVKWICVGVSDENIRVANVGNYILLVMDENSQQYIDNFTENADVIEGL